MAFVRAILFSLCFKKETVMNIDERIVWTNSTGGNNHFIKVKDVSSQSNAPRVAMQMRVKKPKTKPVESEWILFPGIIDDVQRAFDGLGPEMIETDRRKGNVFLATRVVIIPGKYSGVIQFSIRHIKLPNESYTVDDRIIVMQHKFSDAGFAQFPILVSVASGGVSSVRPPNHDP